MRIGNKIDFGRIARALLCLAIAISLNTGFVASPGFAESGSEHAQFLAFASQAAVAQLHSESHRFDSAKHRSDNDSWLVLPDAHSRMRERGCAATPSRDHARPEFSPAQNRSGRSPPVRIS